MNEEIQLNLSLWSECREFIKKGCVFYYNPDTSFKDFYNP